MSFVTVPDVFRDLPVLTGKLVRLEPLTLAVLEDYLIALGEPEVHRLTGARVRFDRPKIEAWLAKGRAPRPGGLGCRPGPGRRLSG